MNIEGLFGQNLEFDYDHQVAHLRIKNKNIYMSIDQIRELIELLTEYYEYGFEIDREENELEEIADPE